MLKKNKKVLAIYGGKKTRAFPMPARYAIGKSEKKAIYQVIEYYSKMKEDPPYDGVYQKNLKIIFQKKWVVGIQFQYVQVQLLAL